MVRRAPGEAAERLPQHLKGVTYPAGKQELIDQAKTAGADEDEITVLGQLPDRSYGSTGDVMRGLGNAR